MILEKKMPLKNHGKGGWYSKKKPATAIKHLSFSSEWVRATLRVDEMEAILHGFSGGGEGGVLKRVITVEFVYSINRPFPSSPGSLYQNEVKCPAFDVEMIFHSHANKTQFHKKGCALGLILKVRVFGTRKWPIIYCLLWGCLRSLLKEGQNNHFHL